MQSLWNINVYKYTQSSSFNTSTAKTRTRLKLVIFTLRMVYLLKRIKISTIFVQFYKTWLILAKHLFNMIFGKRKGRNRKEIPFLSNTVFYQRSCKKYSSFFSFFGRNSNIKNNYLPQYSTREYAELVNESKK